MTHGAADAERFRLWLQQYAALRKSEGGRENLHSAWLRHQFVTTTLASDVERWQVDDNKLVGECVSLWKRLRFWNWDVERARVWFLFRMEMVPRDVWTLAILPSAFGTRVPDWPELGELWDMLDCFEEMRAHAPVETPPLSTTWRLLTRWNAQASRAAAMPSGPACKDVWQRLGDIEPVHTYLARARAIHDSYHQWMQRWLTEDVQREWKHRYHALRQCWIREQDEGTPQSLQALQKALREWHTLCTDCDPHLLETEGRRFWTRVLPLTDPDHLVSACFLDMLLFDCPIPSNETEWQWFAQAAARMQNVLLPQQNRDAGAMIEDATQLQTALRDIQTSFQSTILQRTEKNAWLTDFCNALGSVLSEEAVATT